MAYERGNRDSYKRRPAGRRRRKVCVFCGEHGPIYFVFYSNNNYSYMSD